MTDKAMRDERWLYAYNEQRTAMIKKLCEGWDGSENLLLRSIYDAGYLAAKSEAEPSGDGVKDENGLLPCPCCGAKALFHTGDIDPVDAWVSCPDCGLESSLVMQDEAIESWNRRA